MPGKVKTLDELKEIVRAIKQEGKTVVFTNGCFDLVHRGHLHLLREAKKQGCLLIVGINSDNSIKQIKGPTRPIMSETERAELLAALEMVDYVTVFPHPDPSILIQEIAPDVLVKGGDWAKERIIGRETVKRHGGTTTVIPLLEGYSTTQIIEKIRQEKTWQEFAPSAAKGNP